MSWKETIQMRNCTKHYIDDHLPVDSMPPTIDSNPIGIVVRIFPISY